MNDSSDNAHPLLAFCDSAIRRNQDFNDELSLFEKNSEKWNEFLKLNCDSDNNLIQIVAFQEIGKSGDPGWLDYLFARLQTETMPTNFGPIFWAIGGLGGFQSREDYAHYFEATDDNMRRVAMHILEILPDEDAIEVLLNILKQDPHPDLRREAAFRLAHLGSDAGLQILL
uniref:HEAT repeat domain-containing protein n=1 Tax=uncultured Gimesia sp. TaxID=1678688 RepID=UPI002604D94B